MKNEYDFSHGKRGAVVSHPGKTRISIWIDDDVLEAFRAQAERGGSGYQTRMNQALREHLNKAASAVDEEALRRVLREELQRAG